MPRRVIFHLGWDPTHLYVPAQLPLLHPSGRLGELLLVLLERWRRGAVIPHWPDASYEGARVGTRVGTCRCWRRAHVVIIELRRGQIDLGRWRQLSPALRIGFIGPRRCARQRGRDYRPLWELDG